MIKIAFSDLWEPFDPNKNFITELLKSIGKSIEVVSPEECEILFYSCYSQQHLKYKPKMKIFVTGENKRPNFNECDYSLSFDFDDYEGRNIRCPLWLQQFDWFNVGGYTNPKYLIPLESVENNPYKDDKEFFCSMVVNNFFPERKAMFDLLSSYKQINAYGRPWNSWTYGEDIKMDIIHRGKFNICFENTRYEGYYTEKPIHARIARTIPIYYADERFSEDFNSKGFIICSDFSNAEEFMKHIKDIDESKDLLDNYINQPIFNELNYHINMMEDVKNKIKKIL